MEMKYVSLMRSLCDGRGGATNANHTAGLLFIPCEARTCVALFCGAGNKLMLECGSVAEVVSKRRLCAVS